MPRYASESKGPTGVDLVLCGKAGKAAEPGAKKQSGNIKLKAHQLFKVPVRNPGPGVK